MEPRCDRTSFSFALWDADYKEISNSASHKTLIKTRIKGRSLSLGHPLFLHLDSESSWSLTSQTSLGIRQGKTFVWWMIFPHLNNQVTNDRHSACIILEFWKTNAGGLCLEFHHFISQALYFSELDLLVEVFQLSQKFIRLFSLSPGDNIIHEAFIENWLLWGKYLFF